MIERSKKDKLIPSGWEAILYAFIINAVVFLLYALLFGLKPETNDDPVLALLVENSFGDSNGELFYINVLLGKFLRVLYGLFPKIKWYFITQIGMCFAALTAISYIFYRRHGKTSGTVLSVLISGIVGIQCYVVLQFTRSASIVSVAGLLLLFEVLNFNIEKSKVSRILEFVFGFILFFYACLLRFESVGFTSIVMCVIGLSRIYNLFKAKDKNSIKLMFKNIILFACVFAIGIGTYFYNSSYYQSKPEWQEFLSYNDNRSELWDRGFPSYEYNKELYEELGISQSDLCYYTQWNNDYSTLSIDAVQKLVDAKEKRVINKSFVVSFIKAFSKDLVRNYWFAVLLLVSAVCIFLRKQNAFVLLFNLLSIVFVEFVLVYIDRYGLQRIDVFLYLSAIISQLYLVDEYKIKIKLKSVIPAILVIFVVCDVLAVPGINKAQKNDKTGYTFFETIAQDKEHLYVGKVFDEAYKIDLSVSMFQAIEPNLFDNIYYPGGWNELIPPRKRIIDKYNVDNIYLDIIDNDSILYFSDAVNVSSTRDYIREHYDKQVDVFAVKNIEGQYVWSVRSSGYDLSDKEIIENSKKAVSSIKTKVEKDSLDITGYAYLKNDNSAKQKLFVKIDTSDQSYYIPVCTSKRKKDLELNNGKYSKINREIVFDDYDVPIKRNDIKSISFIIESSGKYYQCHKNINVDY